MRKWYPAALVAVMLVLSAIAYPRLPERVATHFDLDGVANGWGPRWEAAFIVPLIMLAVWGVMRAVPALDPRGQNFERMQGAYWVTVNAAITVLAAAHLTVLGLALGWPISIDRVIVLVMGALFIVIGNVLPQARPNFFFGIRTPWTLSNDRVWERTHRVGGYLMVAAGVSSLLTVFLPARTGVIVMFTAVGVAALASLVYSYVTWKEQIRG